MRQANRHVAGGVLITVAAARVQQVEKLAVIEEYVRGIRTDSALHREEPLHNTFCGNFVERKSEDANRSDIDVRVCVGNDAYLVAVVVAVAQRRRVVVPGQDDDVAGAAAEHLA